MGAFLSKPVTDTYPFDDMLDGKIAYGSSSMQGFRTAQEDAHLCLLDFDKDTYLFAVFDGHGGAEVAQYASKKYPEFLKNNESYKKQDYAEALKQSFLEFDASLIKEEVYKELKALCDDHFSSADENEDMKSNLDALKEEAKMPIHELLERFSRNKFSKKERQSKLKAQKSIQESISSNNDQCSSSMEPSCSSSKVVENGESSSKNNSEAVSSTEESNKNEENEAGCSSNQNNQDDHEPSSSNSTSEPSASKSSSSIDEDKPTSTNDEEDKEATKKRIKPTQLAPKASFIDMLEEIGDDDDDEDDSMEEDDEGDEDSEMYDSEDEDESGDDDEEDDEDESESDPEIDDDVKEEMKGFKASMFERPEGPGKDSGTTAVVALLKDGKLYVANAGDSRCVLSRAGKEIEMSFDHKPTSDIEYKRIKKAGGTVTADGRVNGGLNLSRAFGDHSYKKNDQLPLEEQMITALPDINIIDLQPEDEFIVIACDGIWNSMSSKEVVEYVSEEMKKEKKLSKITDSLFHRCLAEDTRGDGTGCDNMTCIIIKLKDLPTREELLNNKVDDQVKEENKVDSNDLNKKEINEIKNVNELNENGKRKCSEEVDQLNGDEDSCKKAKSE